MIAKIILPILAFALAVECNVRVEFKLAARDLPNMDPLEGSPDPYAIVYYSYSRQNQFFKIGETQHALNTHDVKWPEVFTFDYANPGSQQRIRVEVWDYDLNANDEIGTVEFDLSELVDSVGHKLERNITGLTNQGVLTVTQLVA